MAGDRTLKLSILADVSNLTKSLGTGSKEVESFGSQISDFSEKAVKSMAVAGAAVASYVSLVIKNAAEDEAAQRKLEETIKSSTKATEDQVAAVSDYIDKTSVAIGVTDDKLRPALARLVRSTEDVQKAQDLLNLALDISAATGKELPQISDALGKAYDGNTQALGRLGLGLDQSLLKSKDFDAIYQKLTKTFGSFAENEAETTIKKFERFKIAIDESQESIGAALLPIADKFATFLITTGIPALESFVGGLTGTKGLVKGMTDAEISANKWGSRVRGIIDTIVELKDVVIATAAVIGTLFVVSKIAAAVQGTIVLINTLITAYNALKASSIVAGVASAFALNPLLGVGAAALAAGVLAAANAIANKNDVANVSTSSSGLPTTSASQFYKAPSSGSSASTAANQAKSAVSAATASTKAATEAVSNIVVPMGAVSRGEYSDIYNPAPAMGAVGRGEYAGDTYNINVTGAIDPEATARQIIDVLNSSVARGGAGSNTALMA